MNETFEKNVTYIIKSQKTRFCPLSTKYILGETMGEEGGPQIDPLQSF